MGIPTDRPTIKAVLLELSVDSVATPFVTTLDDSTLSPPAVPADNEEASA